MKQLKSPLIITLILILSLEVLLWIFLDNQNKIFEIVVAVYGNFIATLIGVYWSIHLTRQLDSEKNKAESQKVLIGTLKLLYSELDVNEIILSHFSEAIANTPRIVNRLYDSYEYLQTYTAGFKSQAFYGSIYSGAMKEITLSENIFNSLQQAYFNTELTINGLEMTKNVFKDYWKIPEQNISNEETLRCLSMLDLEIAKVKRSLELIKRAKQNIYLYLEQEGVKFSVDKEIMNL